MLVDFVADGEKTERFLDFSTSFENRTKQHVGENLGKFGTSLMLLNIFFPFWGSIKY